MATLATFYPVLWILCHSGNLTSLKDLRKVSELCRFATWLYHTVIQPHLVGRRGHRET